MKLTEQFKSFSEEEFAAAFQKEVKTGDFREILTWHTEEGMDVSPFYHTHSGSDLKILSHGNEWEINDRIFINNDFKKANEAALSLLNSGTSSLTFMGKIDKIEDLDILLKEIGISFIEVSFKEAGEKIVVILAEYCEKNKIDRNKLRGCFYSENPTAADFQLFPFMQLFSVNGAKFHNAGANLRQQLAFSIAEGKELIEKWTDAGIPAERVISNIRFSMATGPNFFFEMAKIRALRLLWKNVTKQYTDINTALQIEAETSEIWLAKEDVQNNLIRATFQAISAVLGGVDSIYIHSYSEEPNAQRLSRNVQLVIKEEGFIHKVADAGAGSHYIEEITKELVRLAWKRFQEAERSGGYSASLKNESIQKEIHESALQTKKSLASGKIRMIGVNKHQVAGKEKSLSDTLIYDKDLKKVDLFS